MTDLLDGLACQALRGAAFLLGRLSLESALRLGRLLGRISFYVSGRRKVAYADLKSALGDVFSERERWRILRDHYEHLGQMAVEILRFPLLTREVAEKTVHFDYLERLQKVSDSGRGGILITAHFGNWELSQIAYGLVGKTIHVLAREQKHPKVDAFLNQLRQSHGSVAISRGMGIRQLFRWLHRKELIGILGDQDDGKTGGLILPLFGRKTTIPTGAFELSYRTGAPILPCFIARRDGAFHDFFAGDLIECDSKLDHQAEVEKGAKAYVQVLEDFVRRFPSQWLWGTKRWKYTWTKRLLILSDGKAGHVKQSEAVAAQFKTIQTQYDRPGMEYPTETIEVRFKSEIHKKIFSWIAFFFIPFAQGRLSGLKFFFEPETHKALMEASADFIISAGSGLVPLNLCLARENHAKSIVLMRPGFPYHSFSYDLALVPFHDQGAVPRGTLRTLLTPNCVAPETWEDGREKYSRTLKDPARVKFAVFIGGPTRDFKMELSEIERLFSSLEKIGKRSGDFVVTDSRRTPEFITRFLKHQVAKDPACQRVVITAEENPPYVVNGMMAVAEILIVTEDSISMISEAVSSGKKVIVMTFSSGGLPEKHRRFKTLLAERGAVTLATPENFFSKVSALEKQVPVDIAKSETEILRKRLREIL